MSNNNCTCGRAASRCECRRPQPPASVQADSQVHNSESEQFAQVGTLVERVVLGDVLIQSLVEANFRLPAFARTITPVSRRVTLTNCRVLPVLGDPSVVDLIIEGVVHMHFNYVRDITRIVRDYSVNVPFTIYERVELANDIVNRFGENLTNNEIQLQQADVTDNGFRFNNDGFTFEVFNEPVEVTLLASAVNQRELDPRRDSLNRFNEVNVIMDVYFALQLTQRQRFPDPSPTIPPIDQAASRSIFERFRHLARR